MNITITGQVTKLCPFKAERDHGTIRIDINAQMAPELHELATYLAAFANMPLTHEEFTDQVAHHVYAPVESTWHTAGLEVTCRAVPSERVERTDQASDA